MNAPPRFLIVDDDPITCTLMQRWLQNEAVVDVVQDATSGLQMLLRKDIEYDAVLVDQVMPGMDGMGFMEAVTARGGEHPPVVMMTASSSVTLAVAFMKAGGSDYIEKPLDPDITRLRILRIALAHRERRDQRQRLRDTERERDVLLAAMTHDLRSPLGVIGNIVNLMRDLDDKEEMRTCLDLLGEASRNMYTLADDFLVLAKDRNQAIFAKPMEVDLEVMMRELAKQLSISVRMRKIELKLVLPPQTCKIETDPVRLRQVLTNLADNALKHSRCNFVEIKLEDLDEEVKISISDDGVGLSENTGRNLFEAFKESSSQGGFGLGLAICSRLCQLLRSELVYLPRGGCGSVFSFSLPRRWPRD